MKLPRLGDAVTYRDQQGERPAFVASLDTTAPGSSTGFAVNLCVLQPNGATVPALNVEWGGTMPNESDKLRGRLAIAYTRAW